MMGRIITERMKRVFANSPDFNHLTFQEQDAMLRSNILLCVTLHLARCCCSDGINQVLGMCGTEDRLMFQESKSVLKNRPIRQIQLPDVSPGMTREQMTGFKAMACDLSAYVRSGDSYDVLMHLLLFSSEGVAKNARIQALESKFLLALQRRLRNSYGCAQPAVMDHLYKTMGTIKVLSGMMQKFLLTEKK